MIKFFIGGRPVDPNNIGDALMRAALESITAQIREKLGAIRDPDTGEFPTVVVQGESLENLQMTVEGSPEVIALVRDRLGIGAENEEEEKEGTGEMPRVFLSYTSDDIKLAGRLAEMLQANGIDTWWDKWCISPGASLRQKIDEGLSGCTHFLVLLTPQSINKPWVNQEMDAGLVRKLNDECRFLPIRHKLPASALPPLLSGIYSPEIVVDEDITQLINDIHGVSRKPPLGPAPQAVGQAAESKTGYSPAATAIARLFVERTQHGMFADPQFNLDGLARETGLTVTDVKDGLYELSSLVKVSHDHVLVQASLFTEFDRFWKPWNPADDALKLAADIANDPDFPAGPKEIAERYGWESRRLNPAITYLSERGMLVDYRALGTQPFVIARVVGEEDPIRRFVRSRR
jgi:hypothetical protein